MPEPATKISPSLERRLAAADAVLAVVLLLASPATDGPGPRRPRRDERAAIIAARRAVAERALPAIDAVLAGHRGRRIGEPGALGSIVVETTPAGIRALADLPAVRSILESQPLLPVR